MMHNFQLKIILITLNAKKKKKIQIELRRKWLTSRENCRRRFFHWSCMLICSIYAYSNSNLPQSKSTFFRMGTNESTSEMLNEVKKINSKLRDIIIKNNAEFSQTSVPLPEYDETDMKCFLGDDEVYHKID